MSSKKDLASSRLVSKKEKIFNWIIFVLLLLGAVVMVFPLIYMIATSFMTKNQILSGTLTILPDPILIGKYSEVLKKGQFINGIFNSLKVAIPVLIIGGFTSSLAAFGFAKMRFRGKNALFLALLATIMIPFAVVMIPQYVMFTKLGWTNTLLPLIIPGCFGNVSIIFFLRQNLIGIPDDLMEAAKLDGCGYFRTFLQIFMPLMKGADAQFTSTYNPLIDLNDGNYTDETKMYRLMGNFYLRANIIKGLKFTTTFSPNYSHKRQGIFYATGLNEGNDVGSTYYQKNKTNFGSVANTTRVDWTWDNQFDYNRTFGDHTVGAMALFSLYKSNTEYQYEEGKGIASDHTTFHNLGTASGDKTLSSSYTESSLDSFVFFVNYFYNFF